MEPHDQIVRQPRNRRLGRSVLPTSQEVLLARLLLRVCEWGAADDRDQEFTDVYNEVKQIAEGTLRRGN